jgi:hypothetical protein
VTEGKKRDFQQQLMNVISMHSRAPEAHKYTIPGDFLQSLDVLLATAKRLEESLSPPKAGAGSQFIR